MRQPLIVVLVLVLVVPTFAGVASAQGQRLGGTVVVEEGETVNGFNAYGGRVVIEGRVEGNLTAFAGRVVIGENGTITGRVRAFAGSVVIAGKTGGNVVTYAGHVEVTESGQVGGSFGGGGGSIRLGGEIRNDATVVAAKSTVLESATIDGFLTYAGGYENRGGSIRLGARSVSELALFPPLTGTGGVLFALFLLAGDAFAGALLLTVFPTFANDAAETVVREPQQVALAGLAAVIGLPLAAALAALTVIGLPFAVATLTGFLLLLWGGSIYGRYLLGATLLSTLDREGRYHALVVGLLVTAVIGLIPVIGPFTRALLVLAGIGVVTLGFYAAYESVSERRGGRPASGE